MKVIKLFVYLSLGLLVTAGILTMALPTIFSTHFAKNQLLKKINRTISGTLSIKNLSLGWLSGQKVQGLILQDAQGEKIISIEEVQTDSSLIKLLLNRELNEKTVIKEGNTFLSRGENGVTNVQAAISSKNSSIHPEGKITTIQLVNVNGEFDPKDSVIKASGETKFRDKSGTFNVDGDLQGQMHLIVKAKNFPVELLDHLVALKEPNWAGTVIEALGETADLNIDHTMQKDESNVKIDIRTPLVQGVFQGSLSNKQVVLHTESPLQFTFTPKLYAKVLQNVAPGKQLPLLKEATKGSLTVSKCIIPLGENSSPDLMSADVQATIQLNNAKLEKGPLHEPLEFQQISANLNIPKNGEQATVRLQGTGVQKADPMELDVQLMFYKGLLKSSSAKENQHFQVSVKTKQMPIAFAGNIAALDPQLTKKIQAAFGPLLDVDVQGTLKNNDGNFKGSLKGSQGFASVDGRLQQGVVYLNAPMQTEFNVSPEFAKEVLEPLVPILGSAMKADQPIKLTVAQNNFSFPLFPYLPLNANVGQITLDLGKMYFNNEGELASILKLLNVRSSDLISVWFTPVYAGFSSQTVNIQRFDMLVSTYYPMASWGKVDFGHDKLRMIVGVSSAALQKAFGIPSLDASSMLQIPIRGTPRNPKVDMTRVATKISALTAMAAGGPQGLAIGAAIELISSLREEETPKPTTNPLPWGLTSSSEKTSSNEESKTPSPMKEVEKGLKNAIKKVLPF